LLASGGNDRAVCVYDLRSRDALLERLTSLHTHAVHTVAWNPTDPFQLLSASLDCRVQLLDLRALTRGPLFTLRQHFPRSVTHTSTIHKPVYALGGALVLAPSTARALHVYSSASGELLRTLPMPDPVEQVAARDQDTTAAGAPAFTIFGNKVLHQLEFKFRS
jgi:WD40 repeat protein